MPLARGRCRDTCEPQTGRHKKELGGESSRKVRTRSQIAEKARTKVDPGDISVSKRYGLADRTSVKGPKTAGRGKLGDPG